MNSTEFNTRLQQKTEGSEYFVFCTSFNGLPIPSNTFIYLQGNEDVGTISFGMLL